jgi:hypothetical protein
MCFWGLIVRANKAMKQGQQQREEGKEQVCFDRRVLSGGGNNVGFARK